MKFIGKFILLLSLLLWAEGIKDEDSLWAHIENVEPKVDDAGKVQFLVQWSVYASPQNDTSFGDWYLLEDEKFTFVAQCARDSEFTDIVYSDTVQVNNVLFDGLHIDKQYYLRTLVLNMQNPVKSDVAYGGYFTRYARARENNRMEKEKEKYITLGIGGILIILGIGTLLLAIMKHKKLTT
ncbi:hypothetical protein DRQ33_00900 [bacterium]|nr:MAG: hypothetical protein DRQ33_00900 [bacterium]